MSADVEGRLLTADEFRRGVGLRAGSVERGALSPWELASWAAAQYEALDTAEPGLREAALQAVEALAFWTDSEGRERVGFPVDRDGDSEPDAEAPFVALRAALAESPS